MTTNFFHQFLRFLLNFFISSLFLINLTLTLTLTITLALSLTITPTLTLIRCVVLPGVVLRRGSVLGSGSLAPEDFDMSVGSVWVSDIVNSGI